MIFSAFFRQEYVFIARDLFSAFEWVFPSGGVIQSTSVNREREGWGGRKRQFSFLLARCARERVNSRQIYKFWSIFNTPRTIMSSLNVLSRAKPCLNPPPPDWVQFGQFGEIFGPEDHRSGGGETQLRNR